MILWVNSLLANQPNDTQSFIFDMNEGFKSTSNPYRTYYIDIEYLKHDFKLILEKRTCFKDNMFHWK